MDNSSDEQYWIEKIEEWNSSGLSFEKWTRKNDIPFYKARYWRRKFDPVRKQKEESFIEIGSEEIGNEPPEVNRCYENCKVFLTIRGIQVSVLSGFDPDVLQQIVHVLGGI